MTLGRQFISLILRAALTAAWACREQRRIWSETDAERELGIFVRSLLRVAVSAAGLVDGLLITSHPGDSLSKEEKMRKGEAAVDVVSLDGGLTEEISCRSCLKQINFLNSGSTGKGFLYSR